ncbi:hypothetical protein phytr_4860 [Candidatus Phycorickettsia trachydisci]|uniref:Ankyrin repeat protein n=1 Tax=Candidatus Phycorickettsia trachydisci TaxID=2115978 RepID=A0A2P1P839_9RICK|nr:ankyrin repeat domain-containing protein [Candidatus Phycorickettsia trachydisci]AVP87433.1 hypothetical protein phytr_4860 [Candidatus Phycorickettsia trachydisci]
MKSQSLQFTKPIDYDLVKEQLFNAVKAGDFERMKETLSKFDETGRYLRFAVDENGRNILHVAATSNPEIAEWLCQNRTDFSPSASDNQNLKYVYRLTNFISCGDINGETPLDLAIKHGTLEKIPTLVTEILKYPVAVDFLTAFDKYNRFNMLESLISKGLKIPDIDPQSPSHDDTITEIGKKGMIEVLKLCLKNYHGLIDVSSVIENYEKNLSQDSNLDKGFTRYKSDKYDFGTLGNREVIKWLIEEKGYQHHINDIKAAADKYDDIDMSTFCDKYLFSSTDITGDIIPEEAN